ncbi:uncharacterized protein N7483_011549 [Penicillium malachiteum]|uniref:uncharacterized protein n=1 Tax=Penicillium malachiteum TaxID=1324776 RepID=UPI0025489F3A|nr:uncharacterized protein N7483_011549 [Penicillium malachiteum]KAJ5714368.1 hypothetical protein N7483_011549 [Penicillium malachiteum]
MIKLHLEARNDEKSATADATVIMKVFDRRFATQLQKDEKLQPWTAIIQKDYHHLFLVALNNDGDVAKQDEPWNKVQEEAYLHDHLLDLYKTELMVYNLLKDLQGKDIPGLFATVLIPGTDTDILEPVTQGFPGILSKHIEGFPLTNIAHHAPKETWQSICDEAIRILHLLGDRGILNEDVKTRSFIVNLDSEQPKNSK